MLPIDAVIPELKRVLVAGTSAVLQAPPGAGKTTRVPLELLGESWLAGKRIVMLEPRRLAARGAAHRMASLLNERVGERVGYRMRMDSRVSERTRVEVVTEGVLGRMLQNDPALDGVGLVIFDEFHERSLQADLGLALTLHSRTLLRDDLRILVMSATLDGERVAALLDDAPIVTSEGRAYPVETRYLPRVVEGRIEPAVASAVRTALDREEGDILVFLPGAGEIRRVESMLAESNLGANVYVAVLHGSLSQEEQDRAIAPSTPGRRKVVLSTSIAETSLTIEGVRVVIDSGLMRVPRFSPRSGMTRLETITVSQASADQRRGRAGRLGPGVCYRLWTEGMTHALQAFNSPEINEADLAPLALDMAEWGVSDPAELRWLDAPPAGSFAGARELLARLGALDANGAITAHGRAMASLGLHPRLSHMVLRGEALGVGSLACEIAALLEERDIFKGLESAPDVDLRSRVEALRSSGREGGEYVRGHRVDMGALRRVQASARAWRARVGARDRANDVEAAGVLLAFAYPDRIAQMRAGQPGRFLLRNGRAAIVPGHQLLSESPYLVVADLDGAARESRIYLAAPISIDEIEEQFLEEIEEENVIAWEEESGTVRARRRERLGAIVLREAPIAKPSAELIASALIDVLKEKGLGLLPWNRAAAGIRERVNLLRRFDRSWPDMSDEALLASVDEWLAPHLIGMRRREDLSRLDLSSILLAMLDWNQRSTLDELAPTHWTVPSGSRVPIDYSDPESPVLAVRLQEMFGATETPRIVRGMVPLTLHLLSPAHRPVQVTRDLANFWRTTYFDVKKDLKGRYPKHHWPDDPLQATPTNRAKRRGE